jgi:hypothetical protein
VSRRTVTLPFILAASRCHSYAAGKNPASFGSENRMSQERIGEIERLLRVAEDELLYVQKQRQFLLDQIASLKRERENLLDPGIEESPAQYSDALVTNQSCEEAKILLFRSLFRGREDVYAGGLKAGRRARVATSPTVRMNGSLESVRNRE